jgi:2-methylisocitrate lyase-like PEP mutase family enzyme
VVPGAVNALTARIVEDEGLDAVYVTGAGISNTFLGAPDLGFLSLTELASHVSAMRQAVDLPLIVDADTGFGNAVNVCRTVQVLERAGADAIQLEDQTFPKRCGHFAGKDVIDRNEMVAKIRAAVDTREDEALVVIARTDARAVLGLDEAVDRANAYREAGADAVFVEAPRSVGEMATIAEKVSGPQVINIVSGGVTPALPVGELEKLGFSIALFANLPLLASIHAVQNVLGKLRSGGSAYDGLLSTWDERQRLVGLPKYAELQKRYGG